MKYSAMAELNDISWNLSSVEKLLSDSLKTGRTKDQIKANIRMALHGIEDNKKRLCGYRNSLIPLVPGAKENTVEDELLGIHNDIGTVLFHIAHDEGRKAEKILLSIQKRISET